MNYRTIFVLVGGLVLAGCSAACLSGCRQDAGLVHVSTQASSTGVSAGVRAKGLESYRIAYFAPSASSEAAGQGTAGTLAESDEALAVVEYGPRGTLPSEIKKPSIFVVFSQPVAPLARLGEPVKNTKLMKIDPPLPGIFRWYGSRLLAFESDAELIPQRRYDVTVSDSIRSLGGKALEGNRTFSFETERLSLLSWTLGDGEAWVDTENAHPAEARRMQLIFSYPVNLGEIGKWLEIRSQGESWPFALSRPKEWVHRKESKDQAVILTMRDELPMDTQAELVLRDGARSEASYLGTIAEERFPFHTLTPFKLESLDIESWAAPRSSVEGAPQLYLGFSHPVDPDSLEGCLSVDGRVVGKDAVQVYDSTVVLSEPWFKYGTAYSVRVSQTAKDLWGRALAAAAEGTVETGMAPSYVYVPDYGPRMLEAAFPPKIIWEAQNPLSLKMAAQAVSGPYYRVPRAFLKAKDSTSGDGTGSAAGAGTGAATGAMAGGRFHIEDLLPFLSPGGRGSVAFRWEAKTRSSWDKNRIDSVDTWLTVQVTDIGISTRYAHNRLILWATRLSTGQAVADARVELLEGTRRVLEGKTDGAGLAVFDFPPAFLGSRFTSPVAYGNTEGPLGRGLRLRVTETGTPGRATAAGAAAAAAGTAVGRSGSAPGSAGIAPGSADQVEFIPNNSHNLWRFDVQASEDPFTIEKRRPVTFLFTDRGIYRPGDTVSFRLIDRDLVLGRYTPYQGPFAVNVDSNAFKGPKVASLTGSTTENGGGFGSFVLPADIDPGMYAIAYERHGAVQRFPFRVANFERLRIQAKVQFEASRFYAGDTLRAAFSASYLAGGTLAGAPYTYYWSREPASFNPGGEWDAWRFGPERQDGRFFVDEGKGVLGADGKAGLDTRTSLEGIEGAPYMYGVEASAQDAARQEISSRASVMIHPASFYIGARIGTGTASEGFLEEGAQATLNWALVDPEGKAFDLSSFKSSGRDAALSVEFVHREWKTVRQAGVGGRINLVWEEAEEVQERREIPISGFRGAVSGTLLFTPKKSGLWEIRLTCPDEKGRAAATILSFYASGSGWVRWGYDDVDAISLVSDKKVYAPGETAKVMVRSPLPKGTYLMTLEREGILSQKLISLDGSARTIDVPLDKDLVPIVYLTLSSYSVRSGPPSHTYFDPDLDKPKGIFGVLPLRVDASGYRIDVEVEALEHRYAPGEEATVRLRATSGGKPVAGAELSFMAVDRGVTDLIDYRVGDPLEYFYDPARFPLAVRGADSRSLLMDPVTYTLSDLQGGDSGDDSKDGENGAMGERSDFRATAVFEPFLITGEDGTVDFSFALPDSLTTYRCTAVAADGDRYGLGVTELRVSAPLNAVVAAPRKLRWRDTAAVSVVLTNMEDTEAEAELVLEIVPAAGAAVGVAAGTASGTGPASDAGTKPSLAVDGEPRRVVRIAPGKSAEVSFLVAAISPGASRLVFSLRSPLVNERIFHELTVQKPNVFESVATIGQLGADTKFLEEGVLLPSGIVEGTGSLSLSLSASRLSLLKETVAYLLDYPYDCLEQRTARLLPLIAFGDDLAGFGLDTGIESPKAAAMEGLEEIAGFALPNGSYPYWPGGRRGNYYISLRLAHLAAMAERKGYTLPSGFDRRALRSYLAEAGQVDGLSERDPYLYGYSLWVRSMGGDRLESEIERFLGRGDSLGVSGLAFAGLAALETGNASLARRARDRIKTLMRPGTRTVDLGDFREASRGSLWGSDTERYALALMLFHSLGEDADTTDRLAASLLERQRQGLWSNTNTSFWAVAAFAHTLDDQYRPGADSSRGTDLRARSSLGAVPFQEEHFRSALAAPRTKAAVLDKPPLDVLPRDTLLPLRMEREGTGTLYYTAVLRYGIPAELAAARDEGLGVYVETLDDSDKPVSPDALIAGQTYTRRVVLSSSRERFFVALRSPIPSGAEVLDAALVTSSRLHPPEEEDGPGDDGPGPDGVDREAFPGEPVRFILDDEIRFHWDRFPPGRQEVRYRFRAFMPGVYPTPPTSAECMYEPEVFGRTAGELARISLPGL